MTEPYWGRIEVMGHRVVHGLITEETALGLIRIDQIDGPTQLYGPNAIFCVTPMNCA